MTDTSETSETVVDLISGYSATRRCKYGTWRDFRRCLVGLELPKDQHACTGLIPKSATSFSTQIEPVGRCDYFALRTSKEPNGLVLLYSVRRIPS